MDFLIVWHAISCVLTLFIVGLIGFVLGARGWFSAESKMLLPKLILQVALPPYMLYTIQSTFTHDQLLPMLLSVLVPFSSILLTLLVSLVVARIAKVREGRRGIFCVGFSFSNTIFFGVPVNLALFGETAMPYVLLYYFASTSLVWTLGNYMMARDSDASPPRLFSLATLKRVISPPLIGFLTGLAMVILDLRLPDFLNDVCRQLGGLITPLVVIFIGLTMHDVPRRQFKPTKELSIIMLGRFVVAPLILLLVLHFFPLPRLMSQVFLIQASLPALTATALFAAFYKTDPEFGATVVSVSSLLCMLTIPLFMLFVTNYPF